MDINKKIYESKNEKKFFSSGKIIYSFFLFVNFLLFFFLSGCASSTPTDVSKQNPKLFKEIMRDYIVVDETQFGQFHVLKFNQDEKHSITGKVPNFNIESCSWFFDRKLKDKSESESVNLSEKRININCSEKYFIIEVDRNGVPASRLKYSGLYANVFKKFNKGIIYEADCSFTNISKAGIEESSIDKKTANVECYPYPHDMDVYAKEGIREIIHAYFLYTENEDQLQTALKAVKDEKENDVILEILAKEFNDENKRKNQKENTSLIGRDFEFSNCEYIDFREIPIPNAKGTELRKKVENLLEQDLSKKENQVKLREAIDDVFSCNEKCSAKEKEIFGIFEIKSIKGNRNVLIQKKFANKSDLLKFKRFKTYDVEGKLNLVDFTESGEIERILLVN